MFKDIALASSWIRPVITWKNGKYGKIEQQDKGSHYLYFVQCQNVETEGIKDFTVCPVDKNDPIAHGLIAYLIIHYKDIFMTRDLFESYLKMQLDDYLFGKKLRPEAWQDDFEKNAIKDYFTKPFAKRCSYGVWETEFGIKGSKGIYSFLKDEEVEYLQKMSNEYLLFLKNRARSLYPDDFDNVTPTNTEEKTDSPSTKKSKLQSSQNGEKHEFREPQASRAAEVTFIFKNLRKEYLQFLYDKMCARGWLEHKNGPKAFFQLFSETGHATSTKVIWYGQCILDRKKRVKTENGRKEVLDTKVIPIYVIANLFKELIDRDWIECPKGFHCREILMAHFVDIHGNSFNRIDAQTTRIAKEWQRQIEEILDSIPVAK